MPAPRRLVFGSVAEQYDAARPGYPDALVDDAIAYAGCARGEDVLEVGAGTGKATLLFGARGLRVTAVEPDEAMSAVASLRAATAAADVRVISSDFETADVPAGRFGLLYCAQAWHWVDPDTRYGLARRALRAGGGLAVFWNRVDWAQCELREALVDAYARSEVAIEAYGPMHPGDTTVLDLGEDWDEQVAGTAGFDADEVRTYAWSQTYTSAEYLALLGTHSDHLLLEPGDRARLLDEVATTIDAHGGSVVLPMATLLCLARAV